jgi:hypothetical protein
MIKIRLKMLFHYPLRFNGFTFTLKQGDGDLDGGDGLYFIDFEIKCIEKDEVF